MPKGKGYGHCFGVNPPKPPSGSAQKDSSGGSAPAFSEKRLESANDKNTKQKF